MNEEDFQEANELLKFAFTKVYSALCAAALLDRGEVFSQTLWNKAHATAWVKEEKLFFTASNSDKSRSFSAYIRI